MRHHDEGAEAAVLDGDASHVECCQTFTTGCQASKRDATARHLSGYANDAINQGVLDPSAFIAKPFTGQDLTSKIREALDAKEPPLLDNL